MLQTIVRETAPDADVSVIWLHGLGADGEDFADIIPALELPASLRIRFVFPHAPVRPVTLNGGMPMRAWYDVYGIGETFPQDEEGMQESHAELCALLQHEQASGVMPERQFLVGFSQGGSMALYTGLRHPARLAGIIVLSAWLPVAELTTTQRTREAAMTPVLMMHGRQDTVVDPAYGRASYRLLRELGQPVEWHEYDMPHTVSQAQLRDIGAWLAARLFV